MDSWLLAGHGQLPLQARLLKIDRLWEQHPSQCVAMTYGEESSAKMKINISTEEGSSPKLTETIMPQNQLAFRTIG
jgi:hypothetical protein